MQFSAKVVLFWSEMTQKWPQIAPDRVKNESKMAQKAVKKTFKNVRFGNDEKTLKAIQTFIKLHKNTQNPPRTPPDSPTYCTQAWVETSILTVFLSKTSVSQAKKAYFWTILHIFSALLAEICIRCLVLHNFAQFRIKTTETSPKKMTVNTKWSQCDPKKCPISS